MTHIGFTIFFLVLFVAGAAALWVYTHRNKLKQMRVSKLFDGSRGRKRLLGPPVVTIKLTEGVFRPDRVDLYVGKKYKFRFVRQDYSQSAADVYIPYFHQKLNLEYGKPAETILMFKEVGQFLYTCSNGLYKGWIIVTH